MNHLENILNSLNIDQRGGQRTRIERELTNKSTIRSLFLAIPVISER